MISRGHLWEAAEHIVGKSHRLGPDMELRREGWCPCSVSPKTGCSWLIQHPIPINLTSHHSIFRKEVQSAFSQKQEWVRGISWSEHCLKCSSSSCCCLGKHKDWRQWHHPGWRGTHIPGERVQAWLQHPRQVPWQGRSTGDQQLHFHFCLVFRLLGEGWVGLKKKYNVSCSSPLISAALFFFFQLPGFITFVCLSLSNWAVGSDFPEFGWRDKLKSSLFIIKAGVIIWTFWRNHIVF